jgi:hypothetical protein
MLDVVPPAGALEVVRHVGAAIAGDASDLFDRQRKTGSAAREPSDARSDE